MIRVEGLTKSYDGVQAVKGISFQVNEGEIYGPLSVLPHAAVLCGFLLLFMTLCVRFFRYD